MEVDDTGSALAAEKILLVQEVLTNGGQVCGCAVLFAGWRSLREAASILKLFAISVAYPTHYDGSDTTM